MHSDHPAVHHSLCRWLRLPEGLRAPSKIVSPVRLFPRGIFATSSSAGEWFKGGAMLISSVFAATFLAAAQPADAALELERALEPVHHQVDYEVRCGAVLFQIRHVNAGDAPSRVESLRIDHRDLPHVAEQLNVRADGRSIGRAAILNCNADPEQPVLEGFISASEPGDAGHGGSPLGSFRLLRDPQGRWRAIFPGDASWVRSADRAGEEITTDHHRSWYQASCGGTLFQARYLGAARDQSRVEEVRIDGRDLPDVAEQLHVRAARRPIDRLEISRCGTRAGQMVLEGSIHTIRTWGMPPHVPFRITRAADGEWRASFPR
jgi:hypothetical protein